jgi:hypothetical protein
VRKIVAREAAVGIDIGNDGEQMKDGFFLYLKHRLTGLGGSARVRRALTSNAIRNSSGCWPSGRPKSR